MLDSGACATGTRLDGQGGPLAGTRADAERRLMYNLNHRIALLKTLCQVCKPL